MATASKIDWAGLGKERLEISAEAKTPADWKRLWQDAPHPFPFDYGTCWNFCVEYRVADFEAEIGFLIDGLSLESYALQPGFAMFTDPGKAFFFSVATTEKGTPADPRSFKLSFMVKRIRETVADLEGRGIPMASAIECPWPNSPMLFTTFLTPNGISIDLWGMPEVD